MHVLSDCRYVVKKELFVVFFIKSISEQNIECGYVNRQCP